MQLRGLSEYSSVALVVERPTGEQQYSDTVLIIITIITIIINEVLWVWIETRIAKTPTHYSFQSGPEAGMCYVKEM